MQWELEDIKHHDACPFEDDCELLHPGRSPVHELCVWCVFLHQAEWVSSVFSDMSSAFGEMKKLVQMSQQVQPGFHDFQ